MNNFCLHCSSRYYFFFFFPMKSQQIAGDLLHKMQHVDSCTSLTGACRLRLPGRAEMLPANCGASASTPTVGAQKQKWKWMNTPIWTPFPFPCTDCRLQIQGASWPTVHLTEGKAQSRKAIIRHGKLRGHHQSCKLSACPLLGAKGGGVQLQELSPQSR